MKKLLLLLFVITISVFLFAQTPNQFKYQAVLRNTDGTIMAKENVTVIISILKNDLVTSVFEESHTTTSDKQGMINLNIGSIEDLSIVDWTLGNYFLEISVNGIVIGTSQLLSVPYALYAKTVESISETDPVYIESQAANITASDITNLSNLSGTNTGDQDISGIYINAQAIQDTANKIRAEQAQEIENLKYIIERENNKQSLASDIIAFSVNIEDCEMNEVGLDCEDRAKISMFVKENHPIILELLLEYLISQNGEPTLVQETATFEVEKVFDETDNISDFKINSKLVAGDLSFEFDLSPSACIYSSRDDETYTGDITFKAQLLNKNMLTLTVRGLVQIKTIKTESIGAIIGVQNALNEDKNEITALVNIGNFGDLRSVYIVSITDPNFPMEPVLEQNIILDPYTEHTFEFKIHPMNYPNDNMATIPDDYDIKISLRSSSGRIYDEVRITD